MESRNYYDVLGVAKDASAEQIKSAYKKAALIWHPDRNKGNEEIADAKFKEIGEAYAVLSDPLARKQYDINPFFHTRSIYSSSNTTTFYSRKRNINLPSAVLFTGQVTQENELNIILLGSEPAEKSAFIANLIKNPTDELLSTIGSGFSISKIKLNANTTLLINGMSDTEGLHALIRFYFLKASFILIFDKHQHHIEQCKQNLDRIMEQCVVMPLTYTHDSFELGQAVKLEDCTLSENTAMHSCSPQTALFLSKNLFTHLETMMSDIKLKQPHKNDIIHLGHKPKSKKFGCF